MPKHPRNEVWSELGLYRSVDPVLVATDVGLIAKLGPGLWHDTASVPARLWWVLSEIATPTRLAFMGQVHDGGYRSDFVWHLYDGTTRVPLREEIDDLAEALAIYCGATYLDGRKIRYGLGIGGSGSWHKKRLAWTPEGI